MASHTVISNDQSFENDVIRASEGKLVLVDVWADWCSPCRALMPVLEKLAQEMSDQLTLVKVNADECPEVSARFGVRSLPTVLLFKDGEVVNRFQGALPEQQIRSFLDAYVEHEYDRLVTLGQSKLEQGDLGGVTELREAVALAPDNARVLSSLVMSLMDFGGQKPEWLQEAGERLSSANLILERDPLIQKARSRYQLLSQGIGASDLGALEQQANQNPVGPEAFEYAKALAAQEQYANALERMMTIMKAPGEGVEPSRVKESLIALINTCPDAQLANQWRRQLFTLLH